MGLGIKVASVFHPKANKWRSGRRDWKCRINAISRTHPNPIIIHCASLGEYEMARPLVRFIQNEGVEKKVVVSFFSPSGFDHAKLEPGIEKFYLPLDTPSNMNYLMSNLNPSAIIFIKYDLWFTLIDLAHKAKCNLLLVNYRPKVEDFKRWIFGGLLIDSLKKFNSIYTLTSSYKSLLQNHGLKNIDTGGDTRYGNVLFNAENIQNDPIIDEFCSKFSKIIVCGSIWKEDWEVIGKSVDRLNDWGWIIAPHDIEGGNITRIFKFVENHEFLYYTKTDTSSVHKSDARILVLNCIGKLFASYSKGDVAYVGGGFKTGLHNIIEPAAFGLPVAFGPDYGKFPEAEEFIAQRIGESIETLEQFLLFTEKALSNETYRSANEIKAFLSLKAGESLEMKKSIVLQLKNQLVS